MMRPVFLCVLLLASLLAGCSQPRNEDAIVSGNIILKGSMALHPLITEAADLFTRQHTQVKTKVRGGGNTIQSVVNIAIQDGESSAGLDAVMQDKADMGMTDTYANPATYSHRELTDHIFVIIPFIIVVHPDIHVASLTPQQLTEIFSLRTVHNWAQLGGPDQPITTVSMASRDKPTLLQKTILQGHQESGLQLVQDDSAITVRDIVAQTPGAIGYIPLPFLNSDVKDVAIQGVSATPDNVMTGQYTFWSYGHLYTLKENEHIISTFLNFLFTSQAQELAQSLGYIPLPR